MNSTKIFSDMYDTYCTLRGPSVLRCPSIMSEDRDAFIETMKAYIVELHASNTCLNGDNSSYNSDHIREEIGIMLRKQLADNVVRSNCLIAEDSCDNGRVVETEVSVLAVKRYKC